MKTTFECAGRKVWLYSDRTPGILFLQPVDERDAGLLDRQWDAMQSCGRPLALAAFEVGDWNRDLSPWEAPPVFGKVPFGGGAEETLRFVTDRLLPELRARLAPEGNLALCMGGYSLAGLFALWAATRTALFSGVAAASPSVWFPGWMDYVKAHPILASKVYLSLGDREERAKNPVMATVGERIRDLAALLRDDHSVTLEWNLGNHFQDSELRTAKAFCWVAARERSGAWPQPSEELASPGEGSPEVTGIQHLGYCGVDCSACPDHLDGKCPDCRHSQWPDGDPCAPVACCGQRAIACCGQCEDFPCAMMAEFYGESDGHRAALERMCALRENGGRSEDGPSFREERGS